MLDEARIYDRALSAAEIQALFGHVPSTSDLIFKDGFESGSLGAWSVSATDGGQLDVSPQAALAGTTAGAEGLIDDPNALWVQDDTPFDEGRYRARFYLDPSRFDPGEAAQRFRTRIFIAFDAAPQRRLATVILRRMAGQYALGGTTARDDGTRANGPFFPVTAGPHAVEIEWRRATAAAANDGTFQMWVDGLLVANLTGLDNDSGGIDYARLGAISIKPGASGTILWDEFESRRQTYIGPLP
jgi:hypothetical protein